MAIRSTSASSFDCGGASASAPPFECVADRLRCNDDEDCSVACYDSFADSRGGLCGPHDPGCCNTFVQCGANAVCSISCSYSCANMVINATSSSTLIVSECSGISCNHLTVYCPANGQNNSCQIHAQSNEDLLGLQIYVQHHHATANNVKITHNGSISGTLHCTHSTHKQCSLNSMSPILCDGNIPLECDDGDASNSSNRTGDEATNLMAKQPGQSVQMLWRQVILAPFGLTMIVIVCMFACYKRKQRGRDHEQTNEEEEAQSVGQGSQALAGNGNMQRRKERVLSDTDRDSAAETDHEMEEEAATRRMSAFQQSLSTQTQNQEEIMEDVIREIRRNSQHVVDICDDKLDELQTDISTAL
eukprot:CAMPEP_0197046784 /NCGR_PEP_ID=MMETSP1384-20130603/22420_1 /TAXON_ID=29189 /ORGANISM="Ammonia sp." /LENGTH=359 /DNA_ID=CAMNT_0042478623 /DNA_START=79 /DNA_END=1158 /DNA_ORIENTATION=+